MPTQQSDAVGTALRQEKLKGYITTLGEYGLPRSGLVLLPVSRTFQKLKDSVSYYLVINYGKRRALYD